MIICFLKKLVDSYVIKRAGHCCQCHGPVRQEGLAAAIIVSAEAENQNDPDNPFAAIVVAAKDTVASMVAATVTITVIMVVTTE